MILEEEKKILRDAFENLENAVGNLKGEVGAIGATGFTDGDLSKIQEMIAVYTKCIEIESRITKLRPTINSYVLDMEVQNIMDELIDKKNSKSDNKEDKGIEKEKEEVQEIKQELQEIKDETKEIRQEAGKKVVKDEESVEESNKINLDKIKSPVYIVIAGDNKVKASARLVSSEEVILSVGSIIAVNCSEELTKDTMELRHKLVKETNIIEYQSEIGLETTEDKTFRSLQDTTNIIFGRKVRDIKNMWRTINGETLAEYINSLDKVKYAKTKLEE